MIRIFRDRANEVYALDDENGWGVGPLHYTEWASSDSEYLEPDPAKIANIDPLNAIPNITPEEWQEGEAALCLLFE